MSWIKYLSSYTFWQLRVPFDIIWPLRNKQTWGFWDRFWCRKRKLFGWCCPLYFPTSEAIMKNHKVPTLYHLFFEAGYLQESYHVRKLNSYLPNPLLDSLLFQVEVPLDWFHQGWFSSLVLFPTAGTLPDQEELWLQTHEPRKQMISLPSCKLEICRIW